MRRREFLLASVTTVLSAQTKNRSGFRGIRPGPASSTAPSATPLSLRTASLRGVLYKARPIEADCVRATAYGTGFETTGANPHVDAVFQKLAQLDPWTHAASMIADMALLGSGSPWSRFLLDLHEQFEIIEPDADASAYRLLIVPDPAKVDARKLQAYRKFGGSVYTPPADVTRAAFAEALRAYVPKPAVLAPGLPPEAEVTFLERRTPGGIRRVGHLLYYPDDKPGTLENVQLSFRLPQHPLGVVTIPDQRPIEFVHNEFLTTFTLPRVTGHRAIAFE